MSGKKGRGRRQKMKTVETLVSLLLSDNNLTRKQILDKMMGKDIDFSSLPDFLTVKTQEGRKRLSRQSVYKALDFLKESGILIEQSDKIVMRINRYTVKSTVIRIDMDQVWKKTMDMWIDDFRKSQNFRILPENAKEIVIQQMYRRFGLLEYLDGKDKEELMLFIDQEYRSGKNGDDRVEMYMKLQDFDAVMEYLRMYAKKIRATPQ
ncbi:hypothetical protein ACNF40_07085 [Cuniculiplasma sp. SKW4]|uniref:hypothetical protein n=1 Tax=Cuniculiplasma sp. SKW4 TaxID=3400171 RepID=UPI003FD0A8C6